MSHRSPAHNKHLGYQHLQQAQNPQLLTKKTNEQRFWRKYIPNIIQSQSQKSAVTSISANSNDKQLMLFSHGRTITMYNTQKSSIVKQFTNFNQTITSVCLRNDGRIMAYGDETGKIQLTDTSQKFKLRQFTNHKKRINCLSFSASSGTDQTLYSVSDDMVIRQYDIAAGEVIHSYENGHSDYIKCVRSLKNTQSILTAAYDGYVKMFDFRVHETPVMQFKHGGQVQWLDVFPMGLNFVVCGDKKISSWDIRSDKPLLEHYAGKKSISCIRIALDGSRIITSSHDQYLKVFKADNFELTYQQKLQSPILTFDISKNNFNIGLGLQNKQILIKTRTTITDQPHQSDSQNQKQIQDQIAKWFSTNLTKSKQQALNNKYFYRGIYDKIPTNSQIIFERDYNTKNKKISAYDKMLKKFQYKKAFLESLRKKNMMIFMALVDQYVQRGCLERVLKGFMEVQVEEVVDVLGNLVTDVRYCNVAILLLQKITDLHPDKHTNQEFGVLKKKTEDELECINKLKQLDGMLDLIQKICI